MYEQLKIYTSFPKFSYGEVNDWALTTHIADEIAQLQIQTGISNHTKYFTEFFSNGGTSFLIATTAQIA